MKRLLLSGLALAAVAGGLVASTQPREGCGAMCCRRPADAPVESCLRRNPHTGAPEDFGDATMPGSHAVGSGCEPTECVVGAGIEWLDGGVR